MKASVGLLGCVLPIAVSAWKPKLFARQQDDCLVHYTVEYDIAPTVSGQAIAVKTPIKANTILTPGPFGVPITISNAPTLLDTTFTVYATITRTIIYTYADQPRGDYPPLGIAPPECPRPQRYRTITRMYDRPQVLITTIDPAAANQMGTVFLLVPEQYTTSTVLYTGSTIITTTIVKPSQPGEIGTVLVELPSEYTTISELYTGPTILTTTAVTATVAGQTGTVIIDFPSQYTTISEQYDGLTVSSRTLFTPTVPGEIGTVLISYPSDFTPPDEPAEPSITPAAPEPNAALDSPLEYTTISDLYDGLTISSTTLSTPTVAGETGTVLIQYPSQYTTVRELYDGPTISSTTLFAPTTPGETGTVLIDYPSQYTTISELYDGLTVSSTTIFTPTIPGETGTVVIDYPSEYTTIRELYDGPTISSTTLFTPTLAGETGTILIDYPSQYTFVSQLYDGPTISSTTPFAPMAAGETGTVFVYYPSQYTTISELYDGPTASSTTLFTPTAVGETGTVLIDYPSQYVTIRELYDGPTILSTTLFTPTAAGETGTILIDYPTVYVTITTLYTGSVVTTTTTFVPTVPGETGTVVVESPSVYTTTTSAWTNDFIDTTTLFVPTAPGETGLVLVQTPAISYTTFTRGGPEPTLRTITQSPTNGGTLGSVIIETPVDFVTAFQPIVYPSFTGATATYYPTGTETVGTIIIQTYSSQVRPTAGVLTTVSGITHCGPAPGTITNSVSPLVDGDTGTVSILTATPIPHTTVYISTGSVQTTSTLPPDASGTVTVVIIYPTLVSPFAGVTITQTRGYSGATTRSYFIYPTDDSTTCTEVLLTPDPVLTKTLYSGTGPLPTTVTVTENTGGTPSPVVDVILPSCTYTGLRYYEIHNPYDTTLFNPFYPNYILEHFNDPSLQAGYVGYADDINFVLPWEGKSQILSMPQRDNTHTALVFQGYFAPQTSGTWIFRLFSNDDVTDIWMGPEAYTTWNTQNRLLRGTRSNIFTYEAFFDAGAMVPITILYANGPQTGCLELGVTDPDGNYHNSTAGLFKWPACAGDDFLKYPVTNP